MKAKVLFVYPNVSGIRRIPLGISILSACLKKAGHSVDLFDSTFYQKTDEENEKREELGFVLKVDMTDKHMHLEAGDVREDFIRKLKSFNPDIIAFSLLQDNFHYTRKHFYGFREFSNAFVIAGGVMPTLVPAKVLRSLEIDAAFVGEGERAIVELADNVVQGKNPLSSPNLAYLSNDELVQNHRLPPVPLTELPHHDYELFHEEHLWRPFVGKPWKTGYVELTRGCPYSCTFCANAEINRMYVEGRLRSRDIDQLLEEVQSLKARYNIGIFFFCDENFLSLQRLKEFSEKWQSLIGLPFMIQSRIETIKPEKLAWLKQAGCHTISIGIESGDPKFRRDVLKRHYSNESAKSAFDECHKAGIRTTANNIIGFPGETEEQIVATIALNRECQPDSVSIAVFAPYLGSELHAVSEKEGLIPEDEIPDIEALMYQSCLNFSPEYMEMLQHYFESFHDLVFSDRDIRRPVLQSVH